MELLLKDVKSVGGLCIALLTTPVNPDESPENHVRMTNKEILSAALEHFPEGRTSPACVAWYASKLRNDQTYREKHGGLVPLAPRKTS